MKRGERIAEGMPRKLVRDRVVEIIELSGGAPRWQTLQGDDLKRAVMHKVMEEAGELLVASHREDPNFGSHFRAFS